MFRCHHFRLVAHRRREGSAIDREKPWCEMELNHLLSEERIMSDSPGSVIPIRDAPGKKQNYTNISIAATIVEKAGLIQFDE